MRTTITICVLILMLAGVNVQAAMPPVMNFQARLSDDGGDPIPDSSYGFVFTIYDDSTGGNVLWTESQTVTTVDGIFAVLLGSLNPLDAEVFAGAPRYIGIQMGVEPEIRPRTAVASVPYAFQAGVAAASAGSSGLTPHTDWLAPYFRTLDAAPSMVVTTISIYNADTDSNLVTLSFYDESGSLIDECSVPLHAGGCGYSDRMEELARI